MAWLTLGVSLSHAVASARITTPAPKKKAPRGVLTPACILDGLFLFTPIPNSRCRLGVDTRIDAKQW